MVARPPASFAFAVAGVGVALYSVMDALMKGVSISLGAYNAALWRAAAGVVITGLIWVFRRPRRPPAAVMRLHMLRGSTGAVLVLSFFWGIVRVPLAEGIALSFIAPLITLYLAAVLLGEVVTRWAILSSVMGLVGVGVIMAGRFGAPHSADSVQGVIAILFSAVTYSYILILQRQQAQVASAEESAFFSTLFMGLLLLVASPVFGRLPPLSQVPAIFGTAVFAAAALLALSWAYARAEAKVLVVLEYTAFIWAALFGFIFFGEPVTPATFGGAALIVLGCVLSAWHERAHQPSAEIPI